MKTKEQIESALYSNYRSSVGQNRNKVPDDRFTTLLEGNMWTLGVFAETPLFKDVLQKIEVKFLWFSWKTTEGYAQGMQRVALQYIRDNNLEERYGKL